MIIESKQFMTNTENRNNLKYFIKYIGKKIYSILLEIFIRIFHPTYTDKKYKVTLCAIFKNEGAYLKEWIEFHKIIGVEHFYLYNNNSNDDYKIVLKDYIDNGDITLIDWPGDQQQREVYQDCIKRFSKESNWIGFIDIDEFLIPVKHDNIYDFLSRFKHRGSVLIYWKMFGSSGLIDRNRNRLVTEDFYICWPKYCNYGKCFYNTAFDFTFGSKKVFDLPHVFWTKYLGIEIPPVNIFGNICLGDIIHKVNKQRFPIQINHYVTKSYIEYQDKKARGDVIFKLNPHDEKYFYYHDEKCVSTDYSAYKYLIELKRNIQKE